MIGLNYGVPEDDSGNLFKYLVICGAISLLVLGGASVGISKGLKEGEKVNIENKYLTDAIRNLQKNLIQLSLNNGVTQEDVDNALEVYMIGQSHYRKTDSDILKNVYEKLDKRKFSPEINKKLNVSILKSKR